MKPLRFQPFSLWLLCLTFLLSLGTTRVSGQLSAVDGISTVVGNGQRGAAGDGGPAMSASLSPGDIGFDAAGNLYVADTGNQVIRKIAAGTGIITTVAGNGMSGYSGDGGPATSAMLYNPGMAVDAAGNIFIVDGNNNVIRKVTAVTGIISTIAGAGVGGVNFRTGPLGAATDSAGNFYFATSSQVFRIAANTNAFSTVAGNGTLGYSGNGGPAIAAKFEGMADIAVDKAGNVYISDSIDSVVRRVDAVSGIVTVFAGNGVLDYAGDGGPATSAAVASPAGLAFDSSGNLFITEPSLVRRVDAATGIISTVVGNAINGYMGDGGPALQAEITAASFIAIDRSHNLFITDYSNNRIRKAGLPTFDATSIGSSTVQNFFLQTTSTETINSFTVAASQGNKQEYTIGTVIGCSVDGQTPNAAGTICTVPITFTPAYPGQRPQPLQVVTSAGNINLPLSGLGKGPLAAFSPGLYSTIAGACTTGCAAMDADGVLAANETLSQVNDLRVNSAGDIYFTGSTGLRRIGGTTGLVTTLAPLNGALAIDSAGNISVASIPNSSTNSTVKQFNPATGSTAIIAGIASQNLGNANIPAPGPATKTTLPALTDVAVDSGANIYIATYTQILRVDAVSGLLSYVAGNPSASGSSGDGGPATAALLKTPTGIAFDPAGNLYFSDSGNYVIRRIDAATGMITTVAGNANGTENEGYVGSPTGTFLLPGQLAFDSAGNLYLSDSQDRFLGIRRIDAATNVMTTIAGVDRPGPTGSSQRATDMFNAVGFALDSLGNLVTFTQGINNTGNGVSAMYKVDTSTSLISLPYANDAGEGAPTVGSPYLHAPNETVNLTNIGNAPLTLLPPPAGSSPTVTGAAFKLDDPATSGCPTLNPATASFSLAAGSSCFLAVDFTPTVAGHNFGLITIKDNSLNNAAAVQTVTLDGAALATQGPALSLSPTAIAFANTQVGAASASQLITVTNNGTAAAASIALSIGGANPGSFTQTSTCGASLAANATCSISVTFLPQTAGTALTATVSVASSDPSSPATATLTGTGTAAPVPFATLTPTSLTFTAVSGASSATQTATLSNTGTAPLAITSITLGGNNPSAFVLSSACGTTLAAGANCSLAVTFTPATSGTFTANLIATDNSTSTGTATTTQIASLTGTGTAAPAPQAVLTPISLSFGSIAINTTAPAQVVTLSNAGSAALPITSATLTGSGFALTANTCSTSLAAGASCSFSITFAPVAAGTFTATLMVADSVGTQSSSLTGTGFLVTPPDFTIAPTPATQSSYRGQSVSYTLALASLSSTNPFTAPVLLSASGLPAGATATFSPATVLPGSTSTMTIAVPALTSANHTIERGGIAFAALFFGLVFARRKRLAPGLLLMALALATVSTLSGCGSGNGFAIPTTTSLITITGTSGSVVHSTTVTLTVN